MYESYRPILAGSFVPGNESAWERNVHEPSTAPVMHGRGDAKLTSTSQHGAQGRRHDFKSGGTKRDLRAKRTGKKFVPPTFGQMRGTIFHTWGVRASK